MPLYQVVFFYTWLSPHLSLLVLSERCKYSWETWSRQYLIAPETTTCVPFVYTDLGQSNPLVTTHRLVYVLRHRSHCCVLSTAITVSHRLSSRPLNFLLTHSLFVGEYKVSGTTFFTPRTVWSLPRFQLVRLASVSIATVQASIPQSGPRLRFGTTPLVPCPFAFQPNLDSVCCVAEQTITGVYL